MARRQWVVSGKVQGVGFRWHVREAARRLSLAGWVLNRPDGSVEIAVEGDEPSLDALQRAVEIGPPGARVDAIRRTVESGEPLHAPFSVRR